MRGDSCIGLTVYRATASADTGNYNGNPKYTLYPGRQGEDDAATTERLSADLICLFSRSRRVLDRLQTSTGGGVDQTLYHTKTHDSAFICMTPVNIGHVF